MTSRRGDTGGYDVVVVVGTGVVVVVVVVCGGTSGGAPNLSRNHESNMDINWAVVESAKI